MIKNWRVTIIGILLSVLWYQNYSTEVRWDIVTIPYIQSQLDEATTALKTSADGNAELSASLDKRNMEVAEWKATTKVLATQNEILTTQIDKVKGSTHARVAKLIKQQTPKSCTAAFNLLSTNIGELKWDD